MNLQQVTDYIFQQIANADGDKQNIEKVESEKGVRIN